MQTEETQQTTEDDDSKKARFDLLNAFGQSLSKTRSDAINARQSSGIEDIWREDEEFYEGVDDLNRGDERSFTHYKPPQGGTNRTASNGNGTVRRSRVFPNITAPYVDSIAAHISDILIPTDDRPWGLDPTPVPELDELADEFAAENPDQAAADKKKGFFSRMKGALTGQPGKPAADGPTPEEAFRKRKLARAIADMTQTRIWDWQVESQFNAELRRIVEDGCRVGAGIIKGPTAKMKESLGWSPASEKLDPATGLPVKTEAGMVVRRETIPCSKRVDFWNFYPHGGCGQDIQNGDYTWERDYITTRQLMKLSRDENYIGEQIMLALQEGPMRANATVQESPSVAGDLQRRDLYEIWFGYCTAKTEDLVAAGFDFAEEGEGKGLSIDVAVTMVNDRVIKIALPPVDHCGFPYDVFCVRKRNNFWAGIGYSRMIRTPQKIVVGATRSMMDNAGLAGGPMIVFKQGVVRPADGVAGIGPRKIFYISKDDTSIADATKAIGQIKVDMMVDEMLTIVNFGLRLAEDTTGFPMLIQGQMGGAPDRVGVVQAMERNTNAVKRRIARNFSDDVIYRHVRRYYAWHMTYGPDNEKGDLQINVKGYGALVERDIQNQELAGMFAIITDPRFELDPLKWRDEYLRSRHINPETMAIDDEQRQQLYQRWNEILQASGEDPRVKVAEIGAQARIGVAQLNAEMQGAIQINRQQHEAEQAELDRMTTLVGRAIDKELMGLQQQGVSEDVTRKIKADLAKEVMKITSTMRLAGVKARADLMPKPPIEPIGRAPAGESFQK
jgi:hypothetical protein